MHPQWGCFFCTFGDGGMYDYGEWEVGKKFVEGGGLSSIMSIPHGGIKRRMWKARVRIERVLKVF